MVVIHVKKAAAAEEEEQEFLYECTCTTTVDELSDAVIEVSDLQTRLQTLSAHLKESSPQVAGAVDRALSEAETYVSKEQVVHKRALLPRVLRGHLQSIQKEVRAAAHATGLCDSDVLQLFSDYKHNKDRQLWWAGKELTRGKKLCDYIGLNEKTKIIIILKSACSSS